MTVDFWPIFYGQFDFYRFYPASNACRILIACMNVGTSFFQTGKIRDISKPSQGLISASSDALLQNRERLRGSGHLPTLCARHGKVAAAIVCEAGSGQLQGWCQWRASHPGKFFDNNNDGGSRAAVQN